MSKWYEVEVRTTYVIAVEVEENEDAEQAIADAGNYVFASDDSEFDATLIEDRNVLSLCRHATDVLALPEESTS